MRYKIITLCILFSLLALPVLAQDTTVTVDDDLPKAGWTPTHPLYFLDEWIEKIDLFFTYKAEKKAEKLLRFSGEKLAEMKVIVERQQKKTEAQKQKLIQKALEHQE